MAAPRVAILGCGGMAESHRRALAVARLEVVAVADRRPAAAAALAGRLPGARAFDDALQLLREVQPELVTVVTNGPSHAALTLAAVAAGARYILCEKPIACRLRDAREMIDGCAARGVRLAINHTRRWSPSHRRLATALQGGLIGLPRVYLLTLGAGRLGCNATHLVDLVRLLSGQEVVRVQGWLDRTGTPDPRGPEFRDPGGHAVLWLADGARVYLDQMEDLGVPPACEIVGGIGRVRVEELAGQWRLQVRAAADRQRSLLDYGCPLVDEPLDLSDCPDLSRWDEVQAAAYQNLLSADPPACGGEDGYAAVEVVMAIHLSDQRGAPVDLPLRGDDLDFRVDFT
ncbi:MAG: Gfo/Idh/MocA family oxidoreductase [Fimbriimonadaceae bacterium]|nr:Gfo/Idh/MocA family oxidoreductase [Fimbriimonadaceae bacterium]